ncbi:MAG: PIN domain-containing protein [Eubacterium sp.]|nr:PIN domain-containing protein [Eubacterium sp.]
MLSRVFIREFKTVPFSHEAAVRYGVIRNELERAGKPIGPNDLLIAATVLAECGILVTHNVNEFDRIDGLEIEDWC